MSYCRWSSDDYQCDVYVYEDVGGGWVTHVAGSRYVFDEPLPPRVPFEKGREQEWRERHEKVMAMAERAQRCAISLPHDGESFYDATPGQCADTLERLRAAGYNVPQYAIDELRAEAAQDGEQ